MHKCHQTATELLGKMRNSTENQGYGQSLSESSVPLKLSEIQKRCSELMEEPESLTELRLEGGVSVYGLGRFPVTLYKDQWEKLLDMSDDIRAFIQENEPQLKTKGS